MPKIDSRFGYQSWNEAGSKEESARAVEFGRLLLIAVKKHPEAYAEFLRMAEREEAARESRMGCERCRGKQVVSDD